MFLYLNPKFLCGFCVGVQCVLIKIEMTKKDVIAKACLLVVLWSLLCPCYGAMV
jgi:hypothetical protein